MSAPKNNTENYFVKLRELSWLPGNKLAMVSAAETLEPAPLNFENVSQKLHSMNTSPGKIQSRHVSQFYSFAVEVIGITILKFVSIEINFRTKLMTS